MYDIVIILPLIISFVIGLGFLPVYLFRGQMKEWIGKYIKHKKVEDDNRSK